MEQAAARALRGMWARDPQVREALGILGQALRERACAWPPEHPQDKAWMGSRQMLDELGRKFLDLEKMGDAELAKLRALSTRRQELLSALANPDCPLLRSMRGRWPQALAIIGLFGAEFGQRGEPWEQAAFGAASKLGAAWLVGSHPRMAPSGREIWVAGKGWGRSGGDGGLRGREEEECAEFIGAWAAFGEQMGQQDAMGTAAEALARARADSVQSSLDALAKGRGSYEGAPQPEASCVAILEQEWMRACAPGANARSKPLRM